MTENKSIPLAKEIEYLGYVIKGLESFELNEDKVTPVKFDRNKHLILRIDGHKFSTFTQGFDKPFDKTIMNAMVKTTEDLLKYFRGTAAYTQSDEITILIKKPNVVSVYDFSGRKTKIETLAAGYASARFNFHLMKEWLLLNRISTELLLSLENVQDGKTREIASEKKLLKLGTCERIDLLQEMKFPLADYPIHILHGCWIKKKLVDQSIIHPKTGEEIKCKRTSLVHNEGLKFPLDYTTIQTPSFEWLISDYA